MKLLITHGHPTMLKHRHPHLGRLIQPRHTSSIKATAEAGIDWAADNDAFNSFDAKAYVAMLDRIAWLPGCLFVALPDVVGDAKATAELFSLWRSPVKARGLPVALVAQDGIEDVGVPWDSIDALFLGGSNEFKLGEVAEGLVREANARGTWAHMGRVNSRRRVRYAGSIGCDSIDGTKYVKWIDQELAIGIENVSGGRQGRLDLVRHSPRGDSENPHRD